jgi:hypothetical protein
MGSFNDVGYPRVGMEREGASCSPDCVPALDIVLGAEARSVNGLESSQVGMNIVTVLEERGNAVNLFRATPALPERLTK